MSTTVSANSRWLTWGKHTNLQSSNFAKFKNKIKTTTKRKKEKTKQKREDHFNVYFTHPHALVFLVSLFVVLLVLLLLQLFCLNLLCIFCVQLLQLDGQAFPFRLSFWKKCLWTDFKERVKNKENVLTKRKLFTDTKTKSNVSTKGSKSGGIFLITGSSSG